MKHTSLFNEAGVVIDEKIVDNKEELKKALRAYWAKKYAQKNNDESRDKAREVERAINEIEALENECNDDEDVIETIDASKIVPDVSTFVDIVKNIKHIGKYADMFLISRKNISSIADVSIACLKDDIAFVEACGIGKRKFPGTKNSVAEAICNAVKVALIERYDKIDEIKAAKRGKIKFDRYMMKSFDISRVSGKDDQKIIELISYLSSCKTYEKAIKIIASIKKLFNAHINEPYGFEIGDVDIVSNAESQMSRVMGIKDGDFAEDVTQINLRGIMPRCIVSEYENGEKIEGDVLIDLTSQYAELAKLLYARAEVSGFKYGDTVFKAEIASAGQQKKGMSYGISTSALRKYDRLFTGNALFERGEDGKMRVNRKGIEPAKLEQYRTLIASTSVRLEKLGLPSIDVNDVAILPSVKKRYDGKFKVLDCTGKEIKLEDCKFFEFDPFDGSAWFTDHSYDGFAAQIRGFTCIKAMAGYFPLLAYCREKNYSLIATDYWGNEVDLTNKKFVTTDSAAKTAKFYANFEDYAEACRAGADYGFNELYVCSVPHAHKKRKTLSRQTLQTVLGLEDEDIEILCERFINNAEDMSKREGAVKKLLSLKDNFAKLALVLPNIEGSSIAQAKLYAQLEKQIREICFGRVGETYNKYILPDPTAFFDVYLGHMDPNDVKGLLEADELGTTDKVFGEGQMVAGGRYPCNGYKMFVAKLTFKHSKWLCTRCLYMSYASPIVSLIDGDYDGDEIIICVNTIIVDAVKKVFDRIPMATYKLPSGKKTAVPDTKVQRHISSANARVIAFYFNTIGPRSNDVTKLFAVGADADDIYIASALAQLAVDSTKSGEIGAKAAAIYYRMIADLDLPFSQIFKRPERRKDNEGKEEVIPLDDWDYWFKEKKYNSPGNGTVDKVAKYCCYEIKRIFGKMHYVPKYELKTPDWSLCLTPCASESDRLRSRRIGMNDKIVQDVIEMFPESKKEFEELKIEKDGKFKYSIRDFAFVIAKIVMKSYSEAVNFYDDDDDETSDDKDKICKVVDKTNELLDIIINDVECSNKDNITIDEKKNIIIDGFVYSAFMKGKTPNDYDNHSEYKHGHFMQRICIELFGKEMAENVMNNISNSERFEEFVEED